MFDMLDEVVSDRAVIQERLIVAPRAGRFVPLPPEVFTTEGEWVEPGTVLAVIRSGGQETDVTSAWQGWVMGMLAIRGQPVHQGETLFWVRGH
ncbi:MAG: hypothetical protein ACRDLB_14925 [Actinomycetota bacterium]